MSSAAAIGLHATSKPSQLLHWIKAKKVAILYNMKDLRHFELTLAVTRQKNCMQILKIHIKLGQILSGKTNIYYI